MTVSVQGVPLSMTAQSESYLGIPFAQGVRYIGLPLAYLFPFQVLSHTRPLPDADEEDD